MTMRGSCLCGGIRYQADGPLKRMARCHCTQCRKASGAEFATNATVAAASFVILEGEALLATWESSPGNERVFCKRCGSPLFKRSAATPEEVRLRLGCLDDDFRERPAFHVYVASAPRWSEITDSLPRFETVPAER